jgi:molybdopterin/thiamine biosynthesis adenylyltransferase
MDDPSLRYSRHLSLSKFGAEGQQQLARSTALIVGLGGLGAPAALYLANSGIGHLIINDFDRIDLTNLPRQILFRTDDVGEYKTGATSRSLKTTNPELAITEVNERLTDARLGEVVASADVVLDCTDNFPARTMINDACVSSGIPLVSGAAIRFEGQLSVFRPDRPGGPCYRCLYSEDDENLGNCAGQGVLAPLAGTVGCMMATEGIKILIGLDSELNGKLWVYDGLAGSTRLVTIKPRPDCPACGTPRT